VLGRLWSSACTLATLFLLSRWIDESGFGRFTFYLTVFTLLDGLVILGTSQLAVQRTSAAPHELASVVAAARRIRLCSGSIGVAVVGSWAFLSGESGALWILLAALYPLTHSLEVSAVVFKSQIDWRVPVSMRAFAASASLLFVWLARIAGAREPAIYLVAVAAGSTLGNLGQHWLARPHLPRPAEAVVPASGLLRSALPLGLAGIAGQLYFYIDNVFIRAFRGDEELGTYNVAVRFMSVLIMVAQYGSASSLPWFSRSFVSGELGRSVARISVPLFASASLVCGLFLPWSFELLELFRPGFGTAAPSLRWLVAAAAVVYAGAMLLTAVVATGKTRTVLAITTSGFAMNAIGNALAVPRFGAEGAAVVTFATESFVALAAAAALRAMGHDVGGKRPWLWLAGPLGFALGCALSSAVASGSVPG
jgi:O-antigen/teichoic acid export membrane protein